MAVKTETQFLEMLMQQVNNVYQEESKKIVDKHKLEIEKELDNLRDEVVTRAALRLDKQVKISDFGSNITISIIKN